MELLRCFFSPASLFLLLLRSRCDSLLEWCEVLFSCCFSVFETWLFLLSVDLRGKDSLFLELDGLPLFLFQEDLLADASPLAELLPLFLSADFLPVSLSFDLLRSMVIFLGLDCSRNLFPSSMVALMVLDFCNFFQPSVSSANFESCAMKLWPSLMVSFMLLEPVIFFLLLQVWLAASTFSDLRFSADFLPLFLMESWLRLEADPSFLADGGRAQAALRLDSLILTDFLAECLLLDLSKNPQGQLFLSFQSQLVTLGRGAAVKWRPSSMVDCSLESLSLFSLSAI